MTIQKLNINVKFVFKRFSFKLNKYFERVFKLKENIFNWLVIEAYFRNKDDTLKFITCYRRFFFKWLEIRFKIY